MTEKEKLSDYLKNSPVGAQAASILLHEMKTGKKWEDWNYSDWLSYNYETNKAIKEIKQKKNIETMKIKRKILEETVTVKLRRKWQNISLHLFDYLLHKNLLIWSKTDNCYCGIIND